MTGSRRGLDCAFKPHLFGSVDLHNPGVVDNDLDVPEAGRLDLVLHQAEPLGHRGFVISN